jgi:hypothetical protein
MAPSLRASNGPLLPAGLSPSPWSHVDSLAVPPVLPIQAVPPDFTVVPLLRGWGQVCWDTRARCARLRSSAEHCSPKRQFFIPPFSHLAWWCTCVPYELLVRQPFIRRLHCACTHAPCHLSNKSSTRSANKAFALEEESLICSTIKNTRMGVGAFRPVPVV